MLELEGFDNPSNLRRRERRDNMSTSNLIQAFDIVAGSKIQALKFDKTIIGTITEVINSSTGEYRAEYEAGIFKVYAEDPSIVYEKGQSVYIKIPEGDYSNKKFIEGTVKNSENAEKVIDLKKVPIFAPVKYDLVDKGNNIWQNKDDEEKLIKQYITLYKDKGFGKLTATFKGTSSTYQDYGFEGVLQVAQMSGTPFNRENGAQESVLFILKDSISFTFFDNNKKVLEDGTEKYSFNCENAYIEFGEYIDFTTTPYYLVINTPKSNSGNDIILQGVLYHEGEDITDQAITYQWYKEVVGAVDVDAGIGWQKEEGKTTSSLNLETAKGQIQYKLIAFYEEGKSVSQVITINPASGYIKAELDNNNNIQVYYYEGNKNPIPITENIIYYSPLGTTVTEKLTNYEYLTIKVNYNNNIYTTTWKQPDYSTKINFIGDDLYHYNANSDISAEIANVEHTLEPVYIEDNKLIKSISWYMLGEEEPLIIGQYYNPEYSMMKDIWVDNNNILHYMIKDTYAIQNWNNTFKIKIEKIDIDKPETTLKEIFFIKDGQQGTNGTDYCCIVRPVANDGVTLLSEAEAIITNNNDSIKLKAFVYNKGKQVEDMTNISYQWSDKANCITFLTKEETNDKGEKINVEIKDEQICEIFHNSENHNLQYHLVTLKVNINGNTIYYNYPVCYTTENKENIKELSYPKYVQYTAAGVSPEWLDKKIVCEIINNTNTTIRSHNEVLLTIEGKKIKPSATFNFADGIGVIVINDNLYCPVMMYLNTFGNEAINGWDGTSLQINESKGTILAPQIGAGEKDDDTNLFTGVIMGKDNTFSETDPQYEEYSNTGLFGYKQGVNSFGLMSNGNAYFGSSPNNRIWFLGETATIEGGGGGDSDTGMTINLANSKKDESGKITELQTAIKIGNGVFQVDYDGSMKATQGTIGGWTINSANLISRDASTILYSGETINGIVTTSLSIQYTIDQGDSYTALGTLGMLKGSVDNNTSTTNIGIDTRDDDLKSTDYGIILVSGKNIGIKAPYGSVFIEGSDGQGATISGLTIKNNHITNDIYFDAGVYVGDEKTTLQDYIKAQIEQAKSEWFTQHTHSVTVNLTSGSGTTGTPK